MRDRSLPLLWMCAALIGGGAASCGGSNSSATGSGTWTWVDVPETACSDGSSTGFGVNPGDDPDLVFFMDGGGACWDYVTCFQIGSAAAGPVKAPQFEARRTQFAGTFLDRANPANPFRRWTYVFIPYCTGDLHSGDREATYALVPGLPARPWFHRGRANIAADLKQLVPAFPHQRRLVVSGASAGGFGSLLQYDAIRTAWAADETSLIDDSGQPLEGDALNPLLRTAWRSAWNLDPLLDVSCPACRDDFSQVIPTLSARYAQDRIALLSSLQDKVIRTYFGLPPELFEAALRLTVHDRFDPYSNARTFLVTGEDHALLAKPGSYTAGGVSLTTWLTQLVDRDPAWRSVGP